MGTGLEQDEPTTKDTDATMKLPKFRLPKIPSFLVLVLSLVLAYLFGTLEITADELYGIAQAYGPHALYYFPIIGPRSLWDSWVMVFTAMGFTFFAAWVLGYSFRASQRSPKQSGIVGMSLSEFNALIAAKYDLPPLLPEVEIALPPVSSPQAAKPAKEKEKPHNSPGLEAL